MGAFDFEDVSTKPGYSLGDTQSAYDQRLARRQLTYPAASLPLSVPAGVLGYLAGKKFGHGTAGAALGAASMPLLAWLLAKAVNSRDSEKIEDKSVWLTAPTGHRFNFSVDPDSGSKAFVAAEDMKMGIPALVGQNAPAELRGAGLFDLAFDDDNVPTLKARKNLGAMPLLKALLYSREMNLNPLWGFGERGNLGSVSSSG